MSADEPKLLHDRTVPATARTSGGADAASRTDSAGDEDGGAPSGTGATAPPAQAPVATPSSGQWAAAPGRAEPPRTPPGGRSHAAPPTRRSLVVVIGVVWVACLAGGLVIGAMTRADESPPVTSVNDGGGDWRQVPAPNGDDGGRSGQSGSTLPGGAPGPSSSTTSGSAESGPPPTASTTTTEQDRTPTTDAPSPTTTAPDPTTTTSTTEPDPTTTDTTPDTTSPSSTPTTPTTPAQEEAVGVFSLLGG